VDSSLETREELGIFGVPVANVSMDDALGWIESLLARPADRARIVFFVNAHTLNLAARDSTYLRVLLTADRVFGDGTGVRWAARLLHRVRLVDNVNGTDLVPRLLGDPATPGRRLFLLGASPDAVERAAKHVRRKFPRWTLVGHHHGYVREAESAAVIEAINLANPDLLLVGMGNPKQEKWIHDHQSQLKVPLCIAVGGLFTYWAGDLSRAPAWMRRIGFEWLHLMARQPRKVPRYLLGNPAFLGRVFCHRYLHGTRGHRESLG